MSLDEITNFICLCIQSSSGLHNPQVSGDFKPSIYSAPWLHLTLFGKVLPCRARPCPLLPHPFRWRAVHQRKEAISVQLSPSAAAGRSKGREGPTLPAGLAPRAPLQQPRFQNLKPRPLPPSLCQLHCRSASPVPAGRLAKLQCLSLSSFLLESCESRQFCQFPPKFMS